MKRVILAAALSRLLGAKRGAVQVSGDDLKSGFVVCHSFIRRRQSKPFLSMFLYCTE
jgi:hypothetical protein